MDGPSCHLKSFKSNTSCSVLPVSIISQGLKSFVSPTSQWRQLLHKWNYQRPGVRKAEINHTTDAHDGGDTVSTVIIMDLRVCLCVEIWFKFYLHCHIHSDVKYGYNLVAIAEHKVFCFNFVGNEKLYFTNWFVNSKNLPWCINTFVDWSSKTITSCFLGILF